MGTTSVRRPTNCRHARHARDTETNTCNNERARRVNHRACPCICVSSTVSIACAVATPAGRIPQCTPPERRQAKRSQQRPRLRRGRGARSPSPPLRRNNYKRSARRSLPCQLVTHKSRHARHLQAHASRQSTTQHVQRSKRRTEMAW
ncbi:unnamed protein product [Prorocentrum cordatum]|uniref:Uncharacterized protein n=1 Tax=Prorocentrum cordatum TaxID=2364126 RepID=A0ABN9YL23_9DINO|nr:unnamed protein product [Polarella glacialis]